MYVLFNVYKEWRKVSEEMLEDGMSGSVDCGEVSVRKDFSQYAGLENEITFEEMLELEERFKNYAVPVNRDGQNIIMKSVDS